MKIYQTLHKALILGLLGCWSLTSGAVQAEEILDWKACVEEAKRGNPDLVSGKEKVNQAKASKMAAVSGLLPQVTADASATRTKPASKVNSRVNTYVYGIDGQQLIFDGFRTASLVEQAAKTVDSNEYAYLVTSSNVRLRLRTAFANLLRAQDLLHLTEKIAERRKQNYEMIKLRYESGREHRGSLLTSEADLMQANFEVDQAMRTLHVATRQLAKELGRSHVADTIQAKGDFNLPNKDKERPDCEALADTVPLLRQLVAQREAARYGLKSAEASFFPQVFGNASLGRADSHWLPGLDTWSVGATVSMPIFDGGNLTSGLLKNRALYDQAKADEQGGRNGVISTLEQYWALYRDAYDQIAVQAKFLQADTERERIAQAQYSAGLLSFNEWIIIENNLVSSEKTFLNIQAAAMIAQAAWEQAKGETLNEE